MAPDNHFAKMLVSEQENAAYKALRDSKRQQPVASRRPQVPFVHWISNFVLLMSLGGADPRFWIVPKPGHWWPKTWSFSKPVTIDLGPCWFTASSQTSIPPFLLSSAVLFSPLLQAMVLVLSPLMHSLCHSPH